MKFFRLDLLTLLISLFILNGCKRQDGIGLGVNDQNAINGNLIVDSNVIINTVAEDTAATSGLSKTPLANFVDPVFGATKSVVAIGVDLPNDAAYTVPAGTLSIDSAVLVLRYADGFYGDSLASRYKINVYQLDKKIEAKAYYTNSHWDRDPGLTLLGTKTFTARTHDSITIARIRTDTLDTIQRVPPQLRVPFDKNFIYKHLFNAPGSELSSVTAFRNSVKGLYLSLDRAQASDAGGVIQLNMSSSVIDVFYKVVNGTTIDTASVQLPFFNRAAEVTHNYDNTPIKAQLEASVNSPTVSQNTIYLQGLAGLRAKVSFPGLDKLADSAIVLNRAEIVITPRAGSGVPYAPLPKLTMYKLDIANQRTLIQDANAADPRSQTTLFGGSYNRTTKEYHFLVTAYVQDLIRKKTIDYGTFIAPVDSTLVNTTVGIDVAPSVLTAARSVLVGSDKTSLYSIRLNIIYTRIKK